jgi:hypothetical protein
MKREPLMPVDLRLVSESMQLSGFSGKITKAVAEHKPDMQKIAASATRFGAQAPASVRASSEATGRVLQVLNAELLRPVRVHLRTGRRFVIKPTDIVLGDFDGFTVSRPQPKGAPVYVANVRCSEVVRMDLKLKWRISVTR